MASSEELKDARELIDVNVNEVSLVTRGAIRRPFLITKLDSTFEPFTEKGVQSFRDLPLAPRDYAWDAQKAEQRVREWAGATDAPNAKYAKAFAWSDEDAPDEFGSYKLQFADVFEGTLKAVPRAIFAIAAVLEGARSGEQSPSEDQEKLRDFASRWYAKARDEFDDPNLIAPWEEKATEKREKTMPKTDETQPNAEEEVDTTETSETPAPETDEEPDAGASSGDETPENSEKGEEDDAAPTEEEVKNATAEIMGAMSVVQPWLKQQAEKTEEGQLKDALSTMSSFMDNTLSNAQKSEGEPSGQPGNSERSEGATASDSEVVKHLAKMQSTMETLLSKFDGEEIETEKGDGEDNVKGRMEAFATMVSKSVLGAIEPRIEAIEKRQNAIDGTVPAPKSVHPEPTSVNKGEEEVRKSTDELFGPIFG